MNGSINILKFVICPKVSSSSFGTLKHYIILSILLTCIYSDPLLYTMKLLGMW